MFSSRLFLISLAFFAVTTAYSFENELSIGEQQFKLCNTSDIKFYLMVDVGDAALYLKDCNQADTSEYALIIKYNRAFTAEEFKESSAVLAKRNNSEVIYQNIKPDFDKFNKNYQSVDIGDQYQISYVKNQSLQLKKNGTLISESKNKELANAYFNIWFGRNPFSKKMKRNLLKKHPFSS